MKLRACLGVATLLVGLASCGKTEFERFADDLLNTVEAMNGVFARVQDPESARAALPEVERLANQFVELQDKQQKLGDPTPEEDQALQEKYKARTQALLSTWQGHIKRIAEDEEIVMELRGPLMKMHSNWRLARPR